MIDSFRISMALGPLAVYLLVVGAINLSRRPFCVSGTRDLAALGLAVSGMILVGPAELFVPTTAMLLFKTKVWLFLVALVALSIVLVLLVSRPRLVIYNITPVQLRPILAEVAGQLDADARWAGDSLAMPNLGVRLFIDFLPPMRNVSLVSSGPEQDHLGWQRLEAALKPALARQEVARNWPSIGLVTAGGVLGLVLLVSIAHDPHAAFDSLSSMLLLSR